MLLDKINEHRDDIKQIGKDAAKRGKKIGLTPSFADADYERERMEGDHAGPDYEYRHLKAFARLAK